MKLSKAVQGYMTVRLGDGYSQNTLAGYKTHFKQMMQFLGDIEIENITQEDIARFFAWLRTDYVPARMSKNIAPLKSTTLRNAWCAVRSLFNWYMENISPAGFRRPDMLIRKPAVSYPEVAPFRAEEIARMLKACQYTIETINGSSKKTGGRKRPTALRDTLLLLLALDTGLRATELASLTIGDVNDETGEVKVRPINSSKKNKARIAYIGQITRKALWRYLATREDAFPNSPLFLSADHRPLNRTSLRELVTRIGRRAGVENVYPHRFRHTFAIEYLRNGGDIFTLQRLLGHSSLDMVRHYLNMAQVDIENAHRRASPVDNWRL